MFTHSEFSLQSVLSIIFIICSNLGHLLNITSPHKNIGSEDCCDSKLNLTSNVVIVTGSNTGIGKETAAKLAKRGATVVLACRNVKQGMKAMMDIVNSLEKCSTVNYPHCRNGKAIFMRMDLSDLKSVSDFVDRFKSQYSRLDILVNNAGLNTKGVTANGFEQLFQVNYLGHYLLTTLLTDLMTDVNVSEATPEQNVPSVARVINLSSTMHHMGQADFKLSAFSAYTPAMALKGHSYYSDSKLYMNLMTMEINRRFDLHKPYGDCPSVVESKKRSLVSICANPGAVHSDIWRNSVLTSLNFVMKWLFLDVDQGSATSVRAATIDIEELRDYQRQYAKSVGEVKLGDNFQFCADLPCLIPYAMPARPSLAYETMGPFAGPSFGRVSFPSPCAIQGLSVEQVDTPNKLARALWEYSAQLCEEAQRGVVDTATEK
jgi:NAD(P)-dependent dehydrogenase (short-subunit alcohol dehydrogenase family)